MRSAARTRAWRPAPAGWLGAAGLVVGLGVSFGFAGVVFAIALETVYSLPDGVRANDYVTLGRRTAESAMFTTVSTLDVDRIVGASPEVEWSYGEYHTQVAEAASPGGVSRPVEFRRVSPNFLSVLGIRAVLGDVVADADTQVAVLGAKLWTDVFAGSADVVGEAVTVGDTAVPIIGVAAPGFTGLFDSPPDLWILGAERPSPAQSGRFVTTVAANLFMFGVLRNELTVAALQSLLAEHGFPLAEQRNDRVEVVRGLELRPDARRETRQRLVWLAMVVALLLALSLVAFVDFLAADHAVREDGLAVRLAIGATPGDVFRESVGRHAKYGLWTGVVGVAAFVYVSDVLMGMEPFASALGELGLVSSALGLGVSVFLLVAAFLWSCWVVGRAVSSWSLFHETIVRGAVRRSRLAWAALLFMAAASLLLGLSVALRYIEAAGSNLGFAHTEASMVGVFYSTGPTPEGSRRIRDALVADPTVEAAARSEMLPLLAETIEPKNLVKAAGYPELVDVAFYRNRVDAAFFDVLGAELVAGSLLDAGRTREAVLSRTAAMFFNLDVDDVVGIAVELVHEDGTDDVVTVVGVVEDIPYGGLEEPPKPVLYTLLSDTAATSRFQDFWLIRHKREGESEAVVGLLHQLGGGIDEAYRIGSPAEILAEQFEERSVDAALALAGAFAFVLAVAGVGNALARAVANQARQIGVRSALGATEADETRRIAVDALTDLLLAGVALCAIVLAGRVLAPALLTVVTLPLVFAALAVVGGVCVLGSYLSVRRVVRNR